jgi:hypothetical protein
MVGKRICNCTGGLCVKKSLCYYDPMSSSYDSSSGIDINPYEKNENFGNISKCNCNKNKFYNSNNNIDFNINDNIDINIDDNFENNYANNNSVLVIVFILIIILIILLCNK